MKQLSTFLTVAAAGLFLTVLPAAIAALTPEEKAELERNRALAQEAVSFQAVAANNARNPGSPVGPPQKVTLCFQGKTISVAEPAVAALLKRGATIGPCP